MLKTPLKPPLRRTLFPRSACDSALGAWNRPRAQTPHWLNMEQVHNTLWSAANLYCFRYSSWPHVRLGTGYIAHARNRNGIPGQARWSRRPKKRCDLMAVDFIPLYMLLITIHAFASRNGTVYPINQSLRAVIASCSRT